MGMWFWMHDGSGGNFWWMATLGWVWMLLFWGAVIALIAWGVRRLAHAPNGTDAHRAGPLDIAKERYARGELSQEQFDQLRKDLTD